jgi:hypothetical protein
MRFHCGYQLELSAHQVLHPSDLPVHFIKLLFGKPELVFFRDELSEQKVTPLPMRPFLQFLAETRDILLRDEFVHGVPLS